jgi:integrase
LEQKDALLAGRRPRAQGKADDFTVRDLVNRYLTSQAVRRDNGTISPRTWQDLDRTCGRLVKFFGRGRVVEDLEPDDFEALYSELAKRLNLTSLKVEVQRVRGVFKYAYDCGKIPRPIRFGPVFKAPRPEAISRERNANGSRMFTADELRVIIAEAKQPLKAMVMLALNTGFGNSDLASLPFSALNLQRGWVDYPRVKTGVARRIPLWAETVESIREAIAERPKPRDPADTELVFLGAWGNRWVHWNGRSSKDNLCPAFRRLLDGLGLWHPGRSFYSLRHVVETVGGECRDQVAVDRIMGHKTPGMGSVYREGVSDDRLRAVVETVRAWLWPEVR